MFPANQLPEIINENNNASTEPENTKQTKDKLTYGQRCGTLSCIIFIIIIIAISVFIGLFSIFVPKQNNDTSTTEIVTLTFVLPITQNTSQILSLNNNLLIANNYLNSAQCNILKTCLQKQLILGNQTNLMTILSIDSAHAQYSGITSTSQTILSQRKKRQRIRRQISSTLADQLVFTVSIECTPLISKKDCQQSIQIVLDNGNALQCTSTNLFLTTLRSLPITIKTAKVVVAQTHHWRQVGELFLAFGLTSLIGLERQLRGKNAGLRTHSIVGVTSALILQVSKYGFSDVIHEGMVVLDPSRIAAQIISGISFLGAGLIITRQKAIRGLTTAASVWSAAAIGMAAGCGLWILSLAVTGLHFVILLGFLPLEKRLPIFDKNSPFHRKGDDDDNDDDSDTQSV